MNPDMVLGVAIGFNICVFFVLLLGNIVRVDKGKQQKQINDSLQMQNESFEAQRQGLKLAQEHLQAQRETNQLLRALIQKLSKQ